MSLEERLRQLQDALRDFGPNSQHLLSGKNFLFPHNISAFVRME